MAKTFSTPSKLKIRQEWNLPILKFLSEKLGKKLIYLGLPSPDADDIYDWIDYIDKIIAFQCRDYPNQSDPSQDREAIDKLEENLNKLETQGKISTFTIYDGYIEEVLLRGRDIVNNEYLQDDTITVYNLDYCNSLTAPIQYLDNTGEVREGYKFQTIQKLMEHQRSILTPSKKFVLFLTINCSYYEPEMGKLIHEGCEKALEPIHKTYEEIEDSIEKNSRLLKSYTIQNLCDFFRVNGFVPEFLPTINYNGKPLPNTKGKKDFILLHFTVLGTQMKENTGIAPFYQNLVDLLNEDFIYIREGRIVESPMAEIEEIKPKYTPIIYIENNNSYKKHWIE